MSEKMIKAILEYREAKRFENEAFRASVEARDVMLQCDDESFAANEDKFIRLAAEYQSKRRTTASCQQRLLNAALLEEI
jgi:hypothetical protein